MKPSQVQSSKFKDFVSSKNKNFVAFAMLFFLTNYAMQAQSPTVTLNPSQHNGYNISCFGKTDGSITANPTGGIPPYTYRWTNGATTQTTSNLAAGYYGVRVTDAALQNAGAELTLTEPLNLTQTASVYQYPNGFNVSLYNAYNGSITITVYGGVAPYTTMWSDGNTNLSRTNLGAGTYSNLITDANGCQINSDRLTLTQPERTDWTMTGNAGINSTTNFIGTTDLKSLSFRTNNAERLLIKDNGELKINSFTGDPGMLFTDVDGIIKNSNVKQTQPCAGITAPVWYSNATSLFTCPGYKVGIGTYDPQGPLHILHSNANNSLIIDRASNTQGETKKPNIFSICRG
nr:SprB repeat-containing protein [Bacteroidota bacterium]